MIAMRLGWTCQADHARVQWRGAALRTTTLALWCGLAVAADDATFHVPAVELPLSGLLDTATREVLARERREQAAHAPEAPPCPSEEAATAAQMPAIRDCQASAFYRSEFYRHLLTRYPVDVQRTTLNGVATEVFLPKQGIAPSNMHRVLINLHGGGFVSGARTTSRTESVPIAALGRIRVVSVDYRQGPEAHFPAASEDVAAVYRALLKDYPAANIGIYGCSAGGLLTAESMAWFQREHLPRPAAIGLLCEGAAYWTEGDSGELFGADLAGGPIATSATNPYFKGVEPADSLAFPLRSDSVLRQFPATLLITGTRDFALSSTVATHAALVQQGVEAQLHVFEGTPHAFFMDPDLPLSREVQQLIVNFFDSRLGH